MHEGDLKTENVSSSKPYQSFLMNPSGSDGTKSISVISNILIASPTEKEHITNALTVIVRGILNKILQNVYCTFTKIRQKRKRQQFVQSVQDRKKIGEGKSQAYRLRNRSCELKKCKEICLKISDSRCAEIISQFWKMTPKERKTFLLTYTKNMRVKTSHYAA